jgi:PAS domain S-box-containing protein
MPVLDPTLFFAQNSAMFVKEYSRLPADDPDPFTRRLPLGLALSFILVAASIAVYGYYYYRYYEEHYRIQVEDGLLACAKLKGEELILWRKERIRDGNSLLKNPVFATLVERFIKAPGDLDAFGDLQEWLNTYLDMYHYDQAILLDTQSVTRLALPAVKAEADSIFVKRQAEVMRTGQVTFQDLYLCERDQRGYLAVLVPIFNNAEPRAPLGMLSLRIDPQPFLFPYIKLWPTASTTAETLLVRREGDEVVFLNTPRFDANTPLSLRFPLTRSELPSVQAALGREGVFSGFDYRGVPVISVLRSIPDSPWSMVARVDHAEVYAPIRERLWQLILLVGVLLFGVGVTAWLVFRRLHLRFYREKAITVDRFREANEYLEKLINHANAPIIVWDPQFRITRFNEAAETLTGRKAAEVVGSGFEVFFPPLKLAATMELIQATLKGKRWEAVELDILHRDGSIRTVLWNSATIYAEDGKTPAATIVQGQDITKRKQAEKALQDSESKFRSLVFHMTEGLALHEMVYDDQGGALNYRIMDVNPAFKKQTGIKSADATGRLATELYQVDSAPFLEIYDRVVRTGLPETFETEAKVLNKKFAVSVYSPKPGWFATLFADISQRVKADETNARLAKAVEQAAETIVITDANATILYANPAFETTTGYTLAEVLGQNPRILKSGKHDAEFYHHMWEVLSSGKVWTGRITNKRKDGALYEEDASLSPVFDAGGKIVNYVGVKRDITREAQLEQQILQVQKMDAIGRLAGGVAHDFNNILAVVLMNASELSDDKQVTPAQVEGLNEIIEAAERGANLTRQMLAFSRRQVMQMRALDLNDVVAGITRMLQRIIGEDITLKTRLAPADMLVWGDSGMIEQVLLNLVVNARDAMPEGGHITMELESCIVDELVAKAHKAKAGAFVLLRVRDDGFGIAAEHLPHVFEPFYTTKVAGKGTGLGLATLHGIVEQHHGWVDVESEVGQGTTFSVYLPRLSTTKRPDAEQTEPVLMDGGKETILVVEDEKSLRMLAVRILRHRGYRLLEASDGEEALKIWREHHHEIDLLVTDVIMPGGISGGKLADQLRGEKPGLKVIYMSGYSGDVTGAGLDLSEGRQFLQKPFSPAKLVQMVRDYLDAV